MTEFLPIEHTILERPYMLFRPFGKEDTGEPINDMTGVSIRENVKYLEEFVSRERGAEAGTLVTGELVKRLNERIPEPAYHVTPEFLASGSTGYSNEFVAYLVEFCIDLSKDPDFQKHLGERVVPDLLIRIMRFFSIRQIYNSADKWVGFYNKSSYLLEKIQISTHSVTIRLSLTPRTDEQFGEYRNACGRIWCNAIKYGIASVPKRVYDLAPAKIDDLCCIAKGEEFCEWRFTWEEPRRTWNPAKALARWVLKKEIEDQKVSFQSQYDELNNANVELQDRKARLEESAAALAHRVEQLTALHEIGIAFTSARDYKTWVQRALQAIINILHYERAMISRYDPVRQVAYDAQLINVPDEVAMFANSLEVPVTDPQSVEGQVLLHKKPVLLDNIHHEWHRLHPLNQQLINFTGAKSFISVPLVGKDCVLGSLTVDRKEDHSLKQDDLNLMITLANQLALALENVDAYREIEALNVGLEAKVQTRTAELEAANDRLKELDRLKSEFFANISHEIRTPLTLNIGAFKTLLKSTRSAEAQEVIQTGLRNASRLLFLINELLDLAKFDSGRAIPKIRCMDFAGLVRSVVANFDSSPHRRIQLKGLTQPVAMEADPRQLKKVLYNLLSNAFKFSDPQEGQVWIRLALKEGSIELEVEDNGIGIPNDQLERIFDRFTQVESSATRRYEGSGIGLALAKEIVTMHGGTIAVESDPGRGSTFTITLPRGDMTTALGKGEQEEEDDPSFFPISAPISSEDEQKKSAPLISSASPKDAPLVLVVDDNADMRGYVERVLHKSYRLVSAKDGADALAQAHRVRPDLIVTDVMMPNMSGHDLLQAVRADTVLHSTPVIFLTARAGTDARVESLEAGADDYLSKPFDEPELLARVGNLIRARAQEREIRQLQKEKLARFLPSTLADMITSGEHEHFLKGHRREITVLFIDLRGFTAFAETAEPEDLQNELRKYQSEMGKLIMKYQGTLERFTGDSIMVFFNDPLPVPNHTELALKLALAMRESVKKLCRDWGSREVPLGAGIGIATGFATLGLMGFEERVDYAAIGPVTNLAARLCDVAKNEQILIPQSIFHKMEKNIIAEPIGNLSLKGIHRAVSVYNLIGLRPDSENLLDLSLEDKSPLKIN
jgi:signal transduction histidine kinase/class 3 adenylate cyclase